jgi:glycosyltransferase involved in cell wall biosynthesis
MASTGERRRLGVLIVVENLPVPFDRRVWNEARALRAAGHSVAIICPTGKGFEARQQVIDGIAIYRHPLPEASRAAAYLLEYGTALFWQIVLSLRAWRRMRFDVIHACNPPDTIFLVAAFWKILFGTRFVFDQHDLCPELYEANFGRRGPLYRVLRGLERMTYRLADIVIATNHSFRRIALERGNVGPDRVFVVRSGPDLERMRIGPPQPALKNGRPFLVGYLGVIGKHEGIEYLLDAIAHIVHERGRRDIQFAVVGGGPELDRMRAAAARLGIDAFVSFPGRVPDDALLAWLNTADVCVNPDEVNDMNDKSTMNKIMEYMALAKPIVQFDVTEGRYSAQAASLYARPNDALSFAAAILELIDDPMRRARMGAFGRERIERSLAWTHEVPKLLAAYDAVAAKRPRRASLRSSRRGTVARSARET